MAGSSLKPKSPPTVFDQEIGRRLKRRRLQLALSQREVAAILGITFQQIQKYETGKNKISFERLVHIAQCLSTDLSYFMGEHTPEPKWERRRYPNMPNYENISQRELDNLVMAYAKIKEKKKRYVLLKLVRTYTQS